jgi:hypothetical protein
MAFLSEGVHAAKKRGNLKQMGELLEQAAKEAGGL